MTGNEQRKNFRVPFKAIACLWPPKQDAKEIRCDKIRDISLKGIYCYSDIKLSVGTTCEMELHVTDSNSKLVLFFKVRVVRTDESGMKVQFEEMDLDSFFSLKDILDCNIGNPEQIDINTLARCPKS